MYVGKELSSGGKRTDSEPKGRTGVGDVFEIEESINCGCNGMI